MSFATVADIYPLSPPPSLLQFFIVRTPKLMTDPYLHQYHQRPSKFWSSIEFVDAKYLCMFWSGPLAQLHIAF